MDQGPAAERDHADRESDVIGQPDDQQGADLREEVRTSTMPCTGARASVRRVETVPAGPPAMVVWGRVLTNASFRA